DLNQRMREMQMPGCTHIRDNIATYMPTVHAVDGLYRPIYRRPGGPPADCPWGLIARATSRVMGRAVKVLLRVTHVIRTIMGTQKSDKRAVIFRDICRRSCGDTDGWRPLYFLMSVFCSVT